MISDDRQFSLIDAVDTLNNLRDSFELLKLVWLIQDGINHHTAFRIDREQMIDLLLHQFMEKAEPELDEALEILDKLRKVSAKVE